MAKIYITQKDNDKYFDQKLGTYRNGFCYISRKVVLVDDPAEIYTNSDYGYIVVKGKQVTVIGGEGSWEIER